MLNVGAVDFHRLDAQVKALGNIARPLAQPDQLVNLEFTVRPALGRRNGRRVPLTGE